MKIRRLAMATGLGVALLVSACATPIAGQAQLNPAAVVAVSSSAEPPTASSTQSESSSDQTAETQTTEQQSSDQTSVPQTTGHTEPQTTGPITTEPPTTTRSSRSSTPGGVTSIPGFSADCNQVLAGVTAFGKLLSAASSGSADAKISQAQVDTALKDLPASGLPTKAQADVNILRAAASGAAGKTVMGLAMTLQDGKVVAAIQDLSTWISTNCS